MDRRAHAYVCSSQMGLCVPPKRSETLISWSPIRTQGHAKSPDPLVDGYLFCSCSVHVSSCQVERSANTKVSRPLVRPLSLSLVLAVRDSPVLCSHQSSRVSDARGHTPLELFRRMMCLCVGERSEPPRIGSLRTTDTQASRQGDKGRRPLRPPARSPNPCR
jgi:hypothetical protein